MTAQLQSYPALEQPSNNIRVTGEAKLTLHLCCMATIHQLACRGSIIIIIIIINIMTTIIIIIIIITTPIIITLSSSR